MWDNDGKLKAFRTPIDRRYYTYKQYLEYKGVVNSEIKKKNVIYTRASTFNQKDDLKNQIYFLIQFTNFNEIIIDEVIEDYGSGLNYNRKKWNKLIDDCMLNDIDTIHITHKDRFIHFRYN